LVAVRFVEEDPAVISTNPQFFNKFTLVIATQVREGAKRGNPRCATQGKKLGALFLVHWGGLGTP